MGHDTEDYATIPTEASIEAEGLCEHAVMAMNLGTILTAFAARAGGTLSLSELELRAVVGHRAFMQLDPESGGVTVQQSPPDGTFPVPTHHVSSTVQ